MLNDFSLAFFYLVYYNFSEVYVAQATKCIMKELTENLAKTNLFSGITPAEISELLSCIHARRAEYAKGEYIIKEGSKVYDFGIVLSGHGRAIKEDAEGRFIILTLLERGSEIGVILAADTTHKSPVSVQAQDDADECRWLRSVHDRS
jgi:CRP-like cAMP-binding protein